MMALPVMTHQFMARFKDQHCVDIAREILGSLKYDGTDVFEFNQAEPNSLYFGNQIRVSVPESAQIDVERRAENTSRCFDYYEMFYKISETKSGCHHPDGILWFRTGTHKVHAEKVSILDIAPSLLNYFEVPYEVPYAEN